MSTAPASSRTHTDAVVTALTSVVTTYDAEGPATPHTEVPYCVVRTDAGRVEPGSLGDRSSELRQLVWVTAVGETREQAQWVADKCRTELFTNGVTVSGRSAHPVTQVSSQMATRDDDVSPPLFYAVDVYRLHTQPA